MILIPLYYIHLPFSSQNDKIADIFIPYTLPCDRCTKDNFFYCLIFVLSLYLFLDAFLFQVYHKSYKNRKNCKNINKLCSKTCCVGIYKCHDTKQNQCHSGSLSHFFLIILFFAKFCVSTLQKNITMSCQKHDSNDQCYSR